MNVFWPLGGCRRKEARDSTPCKTQPESPSNTVRPDMTCVPAGNSSSYTFSKISCSPGHRAVSDERSPSCCKNSRKTWQCDGVWLLTNLKSSWVVLGAGHRKVTNFGVSSVYVTQLCKDFGFGELKGSSTLSFQKPDDNDTILDECEQRRHRRLLGRLLWLYRPDIKNAVCQLSTHVGTATTRDEINIKRLLRYLIGNPACNMIIGCNLDVPGNAGTPKGSVGLETSKIVAAILESQFGSQGHRHSIIRTFVSI